MTCLAAVVFCLALTGCVERWTERLREKCQKEARTIVYDREVWDRYREKIMAKRRENPGGEWSLSDYDPELDFYYHYPNRISYPSGKSREIRDGEISRSDLIYTFRENNAFTFVGYSFGYSTITHTEGVSCFDLTPELYLERF